MHLFMQASSHPLEDCGQVYNYLCSYHSLGSICAVETVYTRLEIPKRLSEGRLKLRSIAFYYT